jgi:adenylate cyclase
MGGGPDRKINRSAGLRLVKSGARSHSARIGGRHLGLIAAVTLCISLWRALVGDPVTNLFEDRLLDLRFQLRGAVAPPASVVMVAIDEPTIDRLGWTPPPRGAIADAIGRIADAEPRVLALDLLFLDQTSGDTALAAELSSIDDIVLGAAIGNLRSSAPGPRPSKLESALQRSIVAVVIGEPGENGDPPRLLLPRPELVGAADLGHVNIARAPDRMARRVPLSLWIGGEGFLPSLSLATARRFAGIQRGAVILRPGSGVAFGGHEIATDRTGAVTLNHYGQRGTIPTVSLIDVLDGQIPAKFFAKRAVFVGVTAESLADLYATPYSADVPGAEVLATLAANLLVGDLLVREAWVAVAGFALVLALAGLIYLFVGLQSQAAAIVAVGIVWTAGAAAVQFAFASQHLWLDATAIFGALSFATLWCAVQRMRAERRLSAELTDERENLSRYMSPFLVDQLARSKIPDFDRRSQDAAVLFVDVAGYTTLVESQPPANTATFLGELHQLYERCASTHRGVISGFEGDGAMIVFGLPEPRLDDAAAALKCGHKLLDEAERFSSSVFPAQLLRLRVSVHHGPVTAAVVGGDHHAQVTITGDTVNVASRLQDVAKAHGVSFVVSRAGIDAARSAGNPESEAFVPLSDEPVRGRVGSVETWAAR